MTAPRPKWQRAILAIVKWAAVVMLALWAFGSLQDPSLRPIIAIAIGVYVVLTRINALEKRLLNHISMIADRIAMRDRD